ncbi:MAG: fibronectin type III domain-containing protein [Deltaproteobacteria bacterium]|nr:fibronectin type III domain-containing protein [Deltaproteobacteria bacterium]
MDRGACLWASARVRDVVAAAVVCLGVLAAPPVADAATALVRWRPPASSGVTGYAVYVRNAGSTYGASPVWSGNPTPAGDGSMSATVTYAPSASGTNYFAVVARSSAIESNLSQELPIGLPHPCRYDACLSKTSCNFANRSDGTACDDESYCNGPEACIGGACDATPARDCVDALACSGDTCDEDAGMCRHVGPPGCCLACDSGDPCLAEACAAGNCSAAAGEEFEIGRMKLMEKAGGIRLVAKARFTLDPSLDPSTTGVVIEMRTVDGAVVYVSSIAPPLIRAGAAKGRYRYTATRVASDQQSNGVTRLDFRIKDSQWLVTIMAETPSLFDAAAQSMLTVSFRLGGICFRKMEIPCYHKPGLAICR